MKTVCRLLGRCFPILCLLIVGGALTGCGGGQSPAANGPVPSGNNANTPTKESAPAAPVKPTTAPARPVTYGLELGKVLDFTKLQLPDGTNFFELHPARASFVVPGTLKANWPVFVKMFQDLGWKSLGGTHEQMNDEYASAMLGKENYLAQLSLSKTGDKPETMVSLSWHGNFDTRTLPRLPNHKVMHESQEATGYRVNTPVADTETAVVKLLKEAGWEPFRRLGRNMPEGTEEQRFLKLLNQGYELYLMIGTLPDQKNVTHVQYNVYALSHAIPLPPGASDVQFDDAKWDLRCRATGDFLAVAEQCQKAFLAAGYQQLSGEKPTEKYFNQRFRTPVGDILMVQTSAKDDHVLVSIKGISAATYQKILESDKGRDSPAQPTPEKPDPAAESEPKN